MSNPDITITRGPEIGTNEDMPAAFTAPMAKKPIQSSLESIIRAIDRTIAGTSQQEMTDRRTDSVGRFSSSNAAAGKPGKYIVFTMADAKYAVAINQVKEVSEAKDVTPVPNVPDWVMGVTTLRGDIVSVVDCGAFLNLTDKSPAPDSSMCVVSNGSRDLSTTLVVDNVDGLCTLSGDPLMPSDGAMKGPLAPYLEGVYEHEGAYLTVLNLDKLLAAMAVS